MNYMDLVANYKKIPRDVCTMPLKGKGVWFFVFVKDDSICIDIAKKHSNSSNIKNIRKLNVNEFDKMLDIYHRRQNGEQVSQEAKDVTRNQVYWYGVFADLDL